MEGSMTRCDKPEDGKLKTCTACKSDKYCNTDGHRNHRKVHKKECKRTEKESRPATGLDGSLGQLNLDAKGASEDINDDEDLFKPPPPKAECPLCFLPLSIFHNTYMICCGTRLCNGCTWKHDQVVAATNAKRALKDPPKPPLEDNCAFCRGPNVLTTNEIIEMVETRMASNDPAAFNIMASFYRKGLHGLPRDSRKELAFRLRAAELGSADACYNISCMYDEGIGVERDVLKQVHYLKLAAMTGHILARHNLGCVESKMGNMDTAVRHWLISASAGDDNSLQSIGMAYRKKCATKDQYEGAIRANKKAQEAMESEERDKAEAARVAGYARLQ